MNESNFNINKIGLVANEYSNLSESYDSTLKSAIIVDDEYVPALAGIDGFSHVMVVGWLHLLPDAMRQRLEAYPSGDDRLPKVGAFALRGPRPNPVSVTVCKLVAVSDNTLVVSGLDLVNGTPILDLKPYISEYDSVQGAGLPDWAYQ